MITDEQFATLSAQVAQIRVELGPTPDFQRDGYLDNPVHIRMHEIGLAIDEDVKAVEDFGKRLAALGTPQLPAPSGDVVTTLAGYGIHIQPNRLGVGIAPDPDSDAAITVGGESAAVIDGISNTKGTDAQNPGEVHKSSLVISDNDGGMRFRQYLQWGDKGRVRNTTNRRASTLGLDSTGNLCKSDLEPGETSDGGQVWYIITEAASKLIRFCGFKPGWTVKVQSVSATGKYASPDVEQL